tara:strand:- start:92 stop:739 length:648 start_codon:yes stop_codon:yes gene_type:complete
MVKIAPSILSANLMHMHDEIQSIDKNGSEYIHIDVMDGHYVDNLTFGANMVKSIRPITQKVLDVHLMITPVKKYIDEYIKAGSDIISFHPEADNNSKDIIKQIKSANLKAGIAVHPRFSINEITEFLDLIDMVIVMTVVPGFGGQKFMYSEINKITELANIRKERNLNYEIEVDGGINSETAQICKDANADVLVAGSYIFSGGKENYKKMIDSLR